MPNIKAQEDGDIEYTIELDEDAMNILHDALKLMLSWIQGEVEPFPQYTGMETREHPGVDMAQLIGPALYVRTRELRQNLVSLVGRDLSATWQASSEKETPSE